MSTYSFSDYARWSSTEIGTSNFVKNTNPVDDRYVVDTYDNILEKIGPRRRYPGLHVYVIDTGKEYWFVGGDNNGNSLQLVEYKPWMNDISSGGGSTIIDNAIVKHLDANNCSREGIPDHLKQTIDDSSSGDEVNVIYTEDGEETFIKYVYLNEEWCIVCGSQTISFELNTYQSGAWDSWSPPSNSSTIRYVKGQNGLVTVYVKHGFCTQYVDATLYADDGSLDIDNDGTADPYGDELLANIKCVKLSSAEQRGYWVRIDLYVQSSDSVNSTLTYTLLLQR